MRQRLLPRLMGAREIAIRLGLSRQRIQQLADRDDFPEPFQELGMGRVWWAYEVEGWISRWREGDADCRPGPGDAAVRRLAERVADHLAERGELFIDGRHTDVLTEFLHLYLASSGFPSQSFSGE
ncbi:helix-turn-helix transcriptional regulator [Actinoplanes sp. HUAS TT8]|uniref:helix-turn-helix transcriptional regulator n=1 Tax=Actinoplanes sp. HUAS TT8 TaxID=3447453 RepID=UPI003F52099B